jgi:hypothetical protein
VDGNNTRQDGKSKISPLCLLDLSLSNPYHVKMNKISNNINSETVFTDRERLSMAEIKQMIKITDSSKGTIYILCPADLSYPLYQHFTNKRIESSLPKCAIDVDGKNTDDELIVVTITLDRAEAEVAEFASSMVCIKKEKPN